MISFISIVMDYGSKIHPVQSNKDAFLIPPSQYNQTGARPNVYLLIIMKPALGDLDLIVLYAVDQSVFFIGLRFFFLPDFNDSMEASRRCWLRREESSCCVLFRALYSSSEMMTTPVSFPRLMMRVSKLCVTLSR